MRTADRLWLGKKILSPKLFRLVLPLSWPLIILYNNICPFNFIIGKICSPPKTRAKFWFRPRPRKLQRYAVQNLPLESISAPRVCLECGAGLF